MKTIIYKSRVDYAFVQFASQFTRDVKRDDYCDVIDLLHFDENENDVNLYESYYETLNKYTCILTNNERAFVCQIMRTQIEYVVVYNYVNDYIVRAFIYTQNLQLFENN